MVLFGFYDIDIVVLTGLLHFAIHYSFFLTFNKYSLFNQILYL